MTTFAFASLEEAGAAVERGDRVITVVASPWDASLWYSDAAWRDATYAWEAKRHIQFHRMTPEVRLLLPDDVDTFSAGENAVYIEVNA